MRFFNTAGPVREDKHYTISPLTRIQISDIEGLIEQEKYFVLHAPRQTGKTSCLLAMMKHFNKQGRYQCLYVNVEAAQAAREDVEAALATVIEGIALSVSRNWHDESLVAHLRSFRKDIPVHNLLFSALQYISQDRSEPVILLIDEIDALIGDTLISVLRQIRSGYTDRPRAFPQSIILCGVRDVRDYRIHSSRSKEIITGGSAFNIKAKSLRLGDFTESDLQALYAQHTAETGQAFSDEALQTAWESTMGQPWLVNALAYETCFEMKGNLDRTKIIDREDMLQARENLIFRRETHLDQLVDKLQEERVHRVIAPMLLSSETRRSAYTSRDVEYVIDLGIIRRLVSGELSIANGIYQEVLPRELVWHWQSDIHQQQAWYIQNNGSLDMAALLQAFQEFFQQHNEHWLERFQYKEAGPQLLLQAFLQRIINGGGRIEREYGLGRGRTDLLVIWPLPDATGNPPVSPFSQGPKQNIVLELKIQHNSRQTTIEKGLKQTAAYMDRCGAKEGHLLIFDQDPARSWSEKIYQESHQEQGFSITVWGC